MNDSGDLGRLIRASRLDVGLSLGQLASAVGRSSSSVRRWERGESVPAPDVLDSLAHALNLDVADLGAQVPAADAPEPVEERTVNHDDEPVVVAPDPTEDRIANHDDKPVSSDEISATTSRVTTTMEDDDPFGDLDLLLETPAAAVPPPVQDQPSRYGRVSSAVWGRRDSWIGWVRGFLTALALVFLFMGLVWALGELLTALKEVLGSFGTGA